MTRHTQGPALIISHPDDTVGIVVSDSGLNAGTELRTGITLTERVPPGHKVALVDMKEGSHILRYGARIGRANQHIPAGAWVHEARMTPPPAPRLDRLPIATQNAPLQRPAPAGHFMGYRNPDGSVGTRNLLCIMTTVQCVSGIVDHAVARIKAELLPKYPNVDGVVALDHNYGCGVAIDARDADIPIRTLRNIAANPNFGGTAMTVSLGCEKLQPSRLFPGGELPDLIRLQDEDKVGFQAIVADILSTADAHLAQLDARRRTPEPLSELVLGMQCGGSDAFSGITANPAMGVASDMLVAAGGTNLFGEITEVRDGIASLAARASSAEVATDLLHWLQWYDDYLAQGLVDRSANTAPGNRAGGLSNVTEKALGSIAKSGTAPISGVVPPGNRARGKGLLFAATPGSDFICGTLMLAAGATMQAFSTGRGTPYSLAGLPTLKISTRSDLARRWHDLIDVDAGPVATGDVSVDEMGQKIFDAIVASASGERTWAERHGIHNPLALFNPAPVT